MQDGRQTVKVLVIDDDAELVDTVTYVLRRDG
jgi:hypothetical protein